MKSRTVNNQLQDPDHWVNCRSVFRPRRAFARTNIVSEIAWWLHRNPEGALPWYTPSFLHVQSADLTRDGSGIRGHSCLLIPENNKEKELATRIVLSMPFRHLSALI